MTPTPVVTGVAAASRVEVGEQVDITVTVESTWPDALVAGFLIMTEPGAGTFVPVEEGTGNVGTVEGEMLPHTLGHTTARELDSGGATFRAAWTAPMVAGGYSLEVYAVTSDDGDGMDDADVSEETNDSVGRFELAVGVGCDLVAYYYDGDADGYGVEERLACEQPAGYAPLGGDCDDTDALVNPGAVEQCSFADEDCDGESMAPLPFYRDLDADGYGEVSAPRVDVCVVPEGYAEEFGDCAPMDPAVHPGAVEVPGNALDDNCDGTVDEMIAPGVGTGAPSPGVTPEPSVAQPVGSAPSVPTSAPTSAPTQLDPDEEAAACGYSIPRGGNTGLAVGWVFVAGLAARRRFGNPGQLRNGAMRRFCISRGR